MQIDERRKRKILSLCKESGCQARASRKTGRIVSARHFCARINPFPRRLAEAFPRADLKPFPRCRSAKVSLPRKSKKITLCARFSGRVAQSVRARHSHCRGHRFESCRDHHFAEKSAAKPRERRPFARFVFSGISRIFCGKFYSLRERKIASQKRKSSGSVSFGFGNGFSTNATGTPAAAAAPTSSVGARFCVFAAL